MFTTRNVVLGVVAVFVISLAWACWSLSRPIDGGGLGGDTYGTKRHGLRALYEILKELGVPVERGLAPPSNVSNRASTIVFWKPDDTLIAQEPAHLHAAGDWLRAGGRIVAAPAREGDSEMVLFKGSSSKLEPETLFKALGGPALETELISLNETSQQNQPERLEKPAERVPDDQDDTDATPSQPPDFNKDLDKLRRILRGEKNVQKSRAVSIQGLGTLARLGNSVKTLELPEEDLQVLQIGDSKPDGRVVFIDSAENERTLVATYHVGAGELVVVAAPMIAENRLIAQQDNSVLVTELIAGAGRPVIFDEFYHGSTVRGNPLWLFTRPGYSVVTLCLLVVAGLLIWREAIFLGPPLTESIPSRRTIGEYVVAMAMFLNRGRRTRPFVLEEVRSGVLHTVRTELGLPPGREQVEELAAVLMRRNPQRATRLIDAVKQIDQALSANQALPEKDAIRLLQGISSCL